MLVTYSIIIQTLFDDNPTAFNYNTENSVYMHRIFLSQSIPEKKNMPTHALVLHVHVYAHYM